MLDDFDCQIQCEEYYDSESYYRNLSPEESLDWLDANMEFVKNSLIDTDNPVLAP